MDNEEKVVTTTTSTNSGTNWPIIAVVIIAIAVLIWFLSQNGNDNQSAQTTPTTAPAMEAMEEEAEEPSTEVSTVQEQTITVAGSNFKFEPNEIRVKKGEKVTITFNSAGGVHDFVIADLDVKTKQLNDGETETVEFTPDKTGSFEFFCSVGNHRAMGMKGTLIVE